MVNISKNAEEDGSDGFTHCIVKVDTEKTKP